MIIIYVEGPADKKFIADLYKHHKPNENIKIQPAGGVENLLSNIKQQLRKDSEIHTVAVIADANDDIKKRKAALNKLQKESGVKFPYFLFPNNKDTGNLETLLLAMCKDKRPMACFAHYKKCIADKKLPHQPDEKAEIYAYSQTLVGAENAKETKRDYTNKKLWKLDIPELKPLKDFLNSLNNL